MLTPWLNIPNLISMFRLLAAPVLLGLAWLGHKDLFLALLAIALLSDAVDGMIARRLGQTSDLGARLDSWGDLAIFLGLPMAIWWLWPEIIQQEAFFVILVLVAFLFPILVGFLKFKRLTNYHTWACKAQAVMMTIALYCLLIGEVSWPFRWAAVFQVLVGVEELVITWRLGRLKSNIPSYWHLNEKS